MAPYLFFHPIFDEGAALTGMPDCKLGHPTVRHCVASLLSFPQRITCIAAAAGHPTAQHWLVSLLSFPQL
jgi:hypothetical protein